MAPAGTKHNLVPSAPAVPKRRVHEHKPLSEITGTPEAAAYELTKEM